MYNEAIPHRETGNDGRSVRPPWPSNLGEQQLDSSTEIGGLTVWVLGDLEKYLDRMVKSGGLLRYIPTTNEGLRLSK